MKLQEKRIITALGSLMLGISFWAGSNAGQPLSASLLLLGFALLSVVAYWWPELPRVTDESSHEGAQVKVSFAKPPVLATAACVFVIAAGGYAAFVLRL